LLVAAIDRRCVLAGHRCDLPAPATPPWFHAAIAGANSKPPTPFSGLKNPCSNCWSWIERERI